MRLALGGRLYRGDERHLVLRSPPGLTARALAAQVGVIDLHPAVELASVFTNAHDLHKLVLDEPGGLVANAQVAHEFEGGDFVLGLGQQVHGREPARKSQIGRLVDRAADEAAWCRQTVRWKYSRTSRRNELLWPQPHAGQAKPAGQRDSISASSHLSSLP